MFLWPAFFLKDMAAPASKISLVVRIAFIVVWAAAIVACISAFLVYPDKFTAENIADFLRRFQGEIWLVYFAMSVLRGLTLLPSTPLIIAGTMLFAGQPFEVLSVCMVGIIVSSSMIYFFSDLLGFSDFFENRRPDLVHRIKARLDHPTGFAFVMLWAFFPAVPTDAVCYVAGTTKMKYWKFVLAIAIGELILCSFYIFSGNYIWRLFS